MTRVNMVHVEFNEINNNIIIFFKNKNYYVVE
jgi:hypothetical protein